MSYLVDTVRSNYIGLQQHSLMTYGVRISNRFTNFHLRASTCENMHPRTPT